MRKAKMEYQDKETGIIPNSFYLHLTKRCIQHSFLKSISDPPQLNQYNTKMITLRILNKKYHLDQFINTISAPVPFYQRHHPFYQISRNTLEKHLLLVITVKSKRKNRNTSTKHEKQWCSKKEKELLISLWSQYEVLFNESNTASMDKNKKKLALVAHSLKTCYDQQR